MKNMKIVLASMNRKKIEELRTLLCEDIPGLEILSLDEAGIEGDIEENGTTFRENALTKARAAAAVGLIGVGDDSGLAVNALDGAPGIFSARYAGGHGDDRANNEKLLRELKGKADRSASFVCAMAAVFPDGREITVEGRVDGVILEEYRGKNGFGYDPLFYYPPFGKTTAEMEPEEKNSISHRGKAVRQLCQELKKLLAEK